MNTLPIFIQPSKSILNISDCNQYYSNGEMLDDDSTFLNFTINNGKAVVEFEGQSFNITTTAWETAIQKNLCIKVLLEDDKLKFHLRKFNPIQEAPEEIPFEDIFIETTKLKNITFDPRLFVPIKTGKYVDEFWSRSGGVLPATNIMITGDPGIGKSSNLMDFLVGIQQTDPHKKVLYISAEMTSIDVQEFLQFYPGLENVDFLFLGEYVTDPNQKIKPYQALQSTLDQGWNVVVIDSLYETQSMIQEDLEIHSFKKGERYMLDLMNKHNSGHNKLNLYTSFLAIQQKNKSGQYVGSKRLEHMTTGFLQMCWDPKEKGKRYMVFEKNRKGKEKIKLYYTLSKENGIIYDSGRHIKEAEFFEMLSQNGGIMIDEMGQVDFEKLFQKEQSLEINA